MMLFCHLHSCV